MSSTGEVAQADSPMTPGGDAEAKVIDSKMQLNEREQKLLNIAVMRCLKSGIPEIDYVKFTKYGDFNTAKTASNTWGKIKAKLQYALDDGTTKDEGGDDAEAKPPKTPKTPKPKATPRKRGRNADEDEAGAEGNACESPKPKRKRASPKKAAANVKAESDADDAAAAAADAQVQAEAAAAVVKAELEATEANGVFE